MGEYFAARLILLSPLLPSHYSRRPRYKFQTSFQVGGYNSPAVVYGSLSRVPKLLGAIPTETQIYPILTLLVCFHSICTFGHFICSLLVMLPAALDSPATKSTNAVAIVAKGRCSIGIEHSVTSPLQCCHQQIDESGVALES